MAERRHDEHPLMRGTRAAVRSDATAFSYSITITVTFGVVQLEVGSPSVLRMFLFVLGATGAFAVIETISSRFFRVRIREEPSEIVVLGTALAPASVCGALAAAAGVAQVVGGAPGWFVAPALATTVYVAATSAQLTFARRQAEKHPPEETD